MGLPARFMVAAFALTSGGVFALCLVGCFGDSEVQRCSVADDCSAPFLCCVGGITTEVEGGSHCVIPDPTLSFCTAYLPHLVEGNPCGRIAPETGALSVGAGIDPVPVAVDQCREGLVCCPATLTCTTSKDCDAPAQPDPGDASSFRSCHADSECAGDEICCEISYYDRDGRCALVRDCAFGGTSSSGGSAVSSGGG